MRWAAAAEPDELMGGAIYQPVRQHVRGVLDTS
jgi:hypothetical protein